MTKKKIYGAGIPSLTGGGGQTEDIPRVPIRGRGGDREGIPNPAPINPQPHRIYIYIYKMTRSHPLTVSLLLSHSRFRSLAEPHSLSVSLDLSQSR